VCVCVCVARRRADSVQLESPVALSPSSSAREAHLIRLRRRQAALLSGNTALSDGVRDSLLEHGGIAIHRHEDAAVEEVLLYRYT
jgi:hypothetical protein